jgi:gas vesicle protein
MVRDDTTDLIAAFLIGATLGIGATLLLRPERETGARRLLREMGAAPARVRTGARDAGARFAEAGREAASLFRDEVSGVVDAARDEILNTAQRAVKEARRSLRRQGRG